MEVITEVYAVVFKQNVFNPYDDAFSLPKGIYTSKEDADKEAEKLNNEIADEFDFGYIPYQVHTYKLNETKKQ